MPLFGKRKIKVTRKEFAKVLLVWLLRQLSEENIHLLAKASVLEKADHPTELFGLDIEKNDDLEKLLQELFIFEMWSIVVNCETVFEDKYK